MTKLADLMDDGSREREWESDSEASKLWDEISSSPVRNFAREIQRVVSPYDDRYTQSHHNQTLSEIMGIIHPSEGGIRDLLFESNTSEFAARLVGSTVFDAALQVPKVAPDERDDPYMRPELFPAWNREDRHRRLETHIDSVGSAGRIDEAPDDASPYVLVTWYVDKVGLDYERVRSAWRNGHIRMRKVNGRVYCSVSDARAWWPAEDIPEPDRSVLLGSERPEPASSG